MHFGEAFWAALFAIDLAVRYWWLTFALAWGVPWLLWRRSKRRKPRK